MRDDDEHILEVVEPAWVKRHYDVTKTPPEPIDESETVGSAGMDELFHESIYECSCGRSFDRWVDAVEHGEVTE